MVLCSFYFIHSSKQKFKNDIFEPLLKRLLGNEKLEIIELNELRLRINSYQEVEAQKAAAIAVFENNRQVAHDIKSPLSVLNLITHNLGLSIEKKSLLQAAVQRINDIANTMLDKKLDGIEIVDLQENKDLYVQSASSITMVVPLIESLVTEKKIEFKDKSNVVIELEIQDSDLVSNLSRVSLSRLLSNLINNAVESIVSEGIVKVCLKASEYFNIITISDNGIGISEDKLKEVGRKGLTSGKKNGNGLGIYNAKGLLSEAGGKLEIHSILGSGTLVTVMFPRSK